MKPALLLLAALGCLGLMGCGAHAQGVRACGSDGQVCLDTPAGTFLTREENLPELSEHLAGRPTKAPYFSLEQLDASAPSEPAASAAW